MVGRHPHPRLPPAQPPLTRQMGTGLSKGQNGEAGRGVPAGSRARVMNAAPRNRVGGRRISLPLPSAPLLSAGSVPRLLRAGQPGCVWKSHLLPAHVSRRRPARARWAVGAASAWGVGVQTAPSRHPPPALGVSPHLLHFSSSFTLWVVGFWRPWVLWQRRENSLVMFTCNTTPALPRHWMREGHYPGGTLP